jgi:mercuric ion transport protein
MSALRFGTTDKSRLSAEALERREAGRQRLVAVGGILGVLAASSCCVLPVVLFPLGLSGAWISNPTPLEPYQPVFAATARWARGVTIAQNNRVEVRLVVQSEVG